MTDKKRRAGKLEREAGTARPDSALAKLTDEEVLAEYDRAWEAATAPAPPPERGPGFEDVGDDALIAQFEAAMAALVAELRAKTDAALGRMLRAQRGEGPIAAAIKAEQERRRPTPPETVESVEAVVIAAPPIEPHAVELQVREPTPPPPTPPGAHTSYAVDDCPCFQCEAHRLAERREAEGRALEREYEHEPVVGAVVVGDNATPEFRAAVRGVHH